MATGALGDPCTPASYPRPRGCCGGRRAARSAPPASSEAPSETASNSRGSSAKARRTDEHDSGPQRSLPGPPATPSHLGHPPWKLPATPSSAPATANRKQAGRATRNRKSIHSRVCSDFCSRGSTAPPLTRVETPAVTGACLLCIGLINDPIVACAIAIASHTFDTTAVRLCGSAAPFDRGNTEC
jgi:hypothetical protein